jgi:hypothetical protein
MKHNTEGYGAKVATTAIIWAFATAMLAICIPLVGVTQSGSILPLTLILGVTGITAVVWRTNSTGDGNISELKNNVAELQQRIVDLEAICSSDDRFLNEK